MKQDVNIEYDENPNMVEAIKKCEESKVYRREFLVTYCYGFYAGDCIIRRERDGELSYYLEYYRQGTSESLFCKKVEGVPSREVIENTLIDYLDKNDYQHGYIGVYNKNPKNPWS
jgi:hypothetical protein